MILKNLKKYISLNLEEKIRNIMKDNDITNLLSVKDLKALIKFMNKKRMYSKIVLEYICVKSAHRETLVNELKDLCKIALDQASRSGDLEIAKFLLELPDEMIKKYDIKPYYYHNNYSVPDDHKDSKILINHVIKNVSREGHVEVLKFLLSEEIVERFPLIDPSSENNDPIINACFHGRLEVVKYLLSPNVVERFPSIDPSVDNNMPVIYAIAYSNNIDLIKYLLSKEIADRFPKTLIDPCAQDNRGIKSAAKFGKIDVIKFFFEDNTINNLYPKLNPAIIGQTILNIAASNNMPDIVEFLIFGKMRDLYPAAPIDPTNNCNETLLNACKYCSADVVKVLLRDQRVIDKANWVHAMMEIKSTRINTDLKYETLKLISQYYDPSL